MTTWNYIIGNEKDFEGAPEWATKRIKGEWSSKQSFCGLHDGHVHICSIGETAGEKMNMGYAHTVIAQREPVESSQWVYHLGTPEMFARMSEGVTHLFRNKQTGVVRGFDRSPIYRRLLGDDYELIGHREPVADAAPVAINDVVNHPSHYTQGGIECIDAITAATVGKTGIEAVCVANVVKYLWRYEEKNGLEDVKKARWYLERLISELESNK